MGTPRVVESARDLDLPEMMDEVLGALEADGQGEFIKEMTDALIQAKEENNFAPVELVVNTWWVSRIFMTHPRIEEAIEAAANLPEDAPQLTAHQVGKLLNVG